MKKIAFVINGKTGNKQQIIKEAESVFSDNYKIAFFTSEYSGHAIELSKQAAEQDFNYVNCLSALDMLSFIVL